MLMKKQKFTTTEALARLFLRSNTEILERTKGDNYQTVASWRKRHNAGGLSVKKAREILLAYGFTEVEEGRYKLSN